MTATSQGYSSLQHPVRQLSEGLEVQADNPPGGDECIRALCKATLFQLENNKTFHRVVNSLLSKTVRASSVEAAMHWRVANQHHILRHPDKYGHFPEEYDENGWHHYLETTYLPGNKALGGIRYSLQQRKVGSNLPQRYDPIALFRYMSDLPERINVLDVGCSQNLGLKALASSDILRPDGSPWCSPEELGRNGGTFYRKSDGGVIGRAREILAQPFGLRKGLGIDIMGRREDNRQWVRNSFRPAEIQEGLAVPRYDFLTTIEPPQVGFYRADIARLDHTNFETRLKRIFGRSSGKQMIHLAIFSTMMYQLTEDERKEALCNVQPYMDPEHSYIIVQDYIDYGGEHREETVTFSQNWFAKPYSYRTMVQTKDGSWAEAFVSKDGRCNEVRDGTDLDALDLPGYKELFGN
jgi:hypothetical protein